jgi:hypothetical protein
VYYDDCLTELAQKRKDINICEASTNEGYRNFCVRETCDDISTNKEDIKNCIRENGAEL